ncbi:DUF1232 domain-containing protein [Carboxydochorda subterranea]|uniref:DUF1232 domain-containing protein n=1 Tax=Carboxydichorda subterranea TaxID=3109565 RepID=A0ABZ1BTT9_9FIRM|nr:DUF1232 domain-containing protein [Limnochorda sp. L945t]WRP16240.1 DUF1232 domain-containing protein [Limnochorda sp. L945t]
MSRHGRTASAGGSAPISWWGYLGRLWRYLHDPGVASWKKTLIFAGLLYVIIPVDLLPSVLIPGVGWLDDLLVLWVGLPALLRELAAYEPSTRGAGGGGRVERDDGDQPA